MSVFDFIPDLACLEIFSKLGQRDLCSASSVCKKWRDISREPRLWKSLTLHDCGRYSLVLDTIERCVLLQEIIFDRVKYWQWMYYFPDCTYLRKLRFNSCDLTAENMSIIIDNVPEIHSIDIVDSAYNYKMVNQVLQLKKLKSLDITIDSKHYDADDVATHLSELNFEDNYANLEKFNLRFRGYIFDNFFSMFAGTLGSYVKSLTLWFFCCYHSRFFYMFSSLTSLTLFDAGCMSDEDLMNIRELRILRELRIFACPNPLTLDANWATSIGFQNLFKDIVFPHLTKVYFEKCDIDDTGLRYLVKSCPSLTIVGLHRCRLISSSDLAELKINNPKIEITDRRQKSPDENEFHLRF